MRLFFAETSGPRHTSSATIFHLKLNEKNTLFPLGESDNKSSQRTIKRTVNSSSAYTFEKKSFQNWENDTVRDDDYSLVCVCVWVRPRKNKFRVA